MIEVLHQRHLKGSVFHVRIDVTVPGAELVATSEPPPQHFHEDVHIALRDAFERMKRELQDHARMVRGDVKSHTRSAAPEPSEQAREGAGDEGASGEPGKG